MKIVSDQNGYAGDHHQLHDCVEPPGSLTPTHRENWFLAKTPNPTSPLGDANAEHDPPPSVQAAGDVVGVVDEEAGVTDGGEALDEVERAEHQQQRFRQTATQPVPRSCVVAVWSLGPGLRKFLEQPLALL